VNSSSALNFVINQPPLNGSCQINPSRGNTSTIFTVTCSDWYNKDNIKDYSVYSMYRSIVEKLKIILIDLAWKTDRSKLMIIAFSPNSTFDVRLPAGNDLHLVIHIRDLLDSITEYDNISSITVLSDLTSDFELIKTLRESNNELNEMLSSGNQNQIGQVINLISQIFDQINSQIVEKALSSQYLCSE
jgi:hypothetical protein